MKLFNLLMHFYLDTTSHGRSCFRRAFSTITSSFRQITYLASSSFSRTPGVAKILMLNFFLAKSSGYKVLSISQAALLSYNGQIVFVARLPNFLSQIVMLCIWRGDMQSTQVINVQSFHNMDDYPCWERIVSLGYIKFEDLLRSGLYCHTIWPHCQA